MIFGVIKPYPSPIISGRGVDVDFPMLAGCLALLGLGLVMITSASSEVAAVQSGNALYMMTRHLIYLVLGLIACVGDHDGACRHLATPGLVDAHRRLRPVDHGDRARHRA